VLHVGEPLVDDKEADERISLPPFVQASAGPVDDVMVSGLGMPDDDALRAGWFDVSRQVIDASE